MNVSVVRLLCGAILAAAVAGCANTPKAKGIPWWPQGPGTTSADLLRVAEAQPSDAGQTATYIEPPHASSIVPESTQAQALRYGDLLFVSGQTGFGPTAEAQVRAAMDKVVAVLDSHALGISNIVSVTLYLRDLDDLPKADAIYASYFRRSLPARSVVGVATLPNGSLIEIAVIAGK